jgi:H+/gluconate symporter-like permease
VVAYTGQATTAAVTASGAIIQWLKAEERTAQCLNKVALTTARRSVQ